MLLKRQILLEKCSFKCLLFQINKCKIQYVREHSFAKAGEIRTVELELFNKIITNTGADYDYHIQNFINAEILNLLYKNEGQT